MLERFDKALRTDEWPEIKVPPRILEFLKNGDSELPTIGPDRKSLQSHYAIKCLNQKSHELLERTANRTGVGELDRFRDEVVTECKTELASIPWPEGWMKPDLNPMDGGVFESVGRNVTLGLTIVSSLYRSFLSAYTESGSPIDFKVVENLTLKTARKIMQLDDSYGVVNSVEKVLGCFDSEPQPVFALAENGTIDITDEVERQLGVVMRNEPEILNLLALERCPAFHHAFINTYVAYLTAIATAEKGIKERIFSV